MAQSRNLAVAIRLARVRFDYQFLIHNTDDHLRNHGLFIDAQGIRLSPAYDINPSIERRDLSLAINEVETACDVSIAMEACRDYGLSKQQADKCLKQARAAVAQWRREAGGLGISRP